MRMWRCGRTSAGPSRCLLRRGQMVLGGRLFSRWPSWWYCYEVYWSDISSPSSSQRLSQPLPASTSHVCVLAANFACISHLFTTAKKFFWSLKKGLRAIWGHGRHRGNKLDRCGRTGGKYCLGLRELISVRLPQVVRTELCVDGRSSWTHPAAPARCCWCDWVSGFVSSH